MDVALLFNLPAYTAAYAYKYCDVYMLRALRKYGYIGPKQASGQKVGVDGWSVNINKAEDDIPSPHLISKI